MKSAVLLLAHGTREPEASKPVHLYAEELTRRSGMRVEPCLREFIEPSVPTVVGKLVADGVERIYVLPFFLFSSGHVTRDIQKDLEAERKKHPKIHFVVGEPLGYDDFLVQLLAKRMDEVIRSAAR